MTTILVTGFGPFPGAPFNPTGPLVKRLARVRRPALANVKIVPYIFSVSYAAVDRDLPQLLALHNPDVLLMFGLAPRAKAVRIETRARNSVAFLPDASGASLHRRSIAPGAPSTMIMPAPARRVLAAARAARVPAVLSRDAGRYLCNYIAWRGAEAAGKNGGPKLAVFVHVPRVARTARRRSKQRKVALDDLTRAGVRMLTAVTCRL